MLYLTEPTWWVREIGQGHKGPDVDIVHGLIGRLGYAMGVPYSDDDAAIIRGLQATWSLETTGWVDQQTALRLQRRADARRKGEM